MDYSFDRGRMLNDMTKIKLFENSFKFKCLKKLTHVQHEHHDDELLGHVPPQDEQLLLQVQPQQMQR